MLRAVHHVAWMCSMSCALLKRPGPRGLPVPRVVADSLYAVAERPGRKGHLRGCGCVAGGAAGRTAWSGAFSKRRTARATSRCHDGRLGQAPEPEPYASSSSSSSGFGPLAPGDGEAAASAANKRPPRQLPAATASSLSPEDIAQRISDSRRRRAELVFLRCPSCAISVATAPNILRHMARCCPDLLRHDAEAWAKAGLQVRTQMIYICFTCHAPIHQSSCMHAVHAAGERMDTRGAGPIVAHAHAPCAIPAVSTVRRAHNQLWPLCVKPGGAGRQGG